MQHVEFWDIWTVWNRHCECRCRCMLMVFFLLLLLLCNTHVLVYGILFCTPPALKQRPYDNIRKRTEIECCVLCLCIHSRFAISANQDRSFVVYIDVVSFIWLVVGWWFVCFFFFFFFFILLYAHTNKAHRSHNKIFIFNFPFGFPSP